MDRIGMTYQIYVNWIRYQHTKFEWIAIAVQNDLTEDFPKILDDLDGDDISAREAMDYIEKNANYIAYGHSPSEAVLKIENKLKEIFSD